MPAPLFIFGTARGGTTLLARMLDAHPRVTVALDPLMPLLRSWRNAIFRHSLAEDVAAGLDPDAPFQDDYFSPHGRRLLDAVIGAKAELPLAQGGMDGLRKAVQARCALESPELASLFSDWAGEDHKTLFDRALDILEGAGNGTPDWVGSKEVWATEFLAPLARVYPEARFIIILRDPRAVIASLEALAAKDDSQMAHTVSYMRHWRKHIVVSTMLEENPEFAGRVLVVKFENLVNAPESEARRLCAFLDIEIDPAMLEPVPSNSSFDSDIRGSDPGPVARWKKVLRPSMQRTVVFHCGPEMFLSGYADELPDEAPFDAEVLNEIILADGRPGSWRSDSGDPFADTGCELLRWNLLKISDGGPPAEMARRCFLFEEIYERLRR